jgi:hypothetical protein
MAWDSKRKHKGESNWEYNRRRNQGRGGKDPSCLSLLLLVAVAPMAAAAVFVAALVAALA